MEAARRALLEQKHVSLLERLASIEQREEFLHAQISQESKHREAGVDQLQNHVDQLQNLISSEQLAHAAHEAKTAALKSQARKRQLQAMVMCYVFHLIFYTT